MRKVKDGAARRFIDSAALHSDKAVLDHVDAADTVASPQPIQYPHDPDRTKPVIAVSIVSQTIQNLPKLGVDQPHTVPFLEEEFQIFGLVRRILPRNAKLI